MPESGLSQSEAQQANGLSLVLFAGGFDRVHYALVMASAAAATNRPVTLFFTGRAITALLAADESGAPGWHRLDPADDGRSPAERNGWFTANGLAGFEELLEACVLLNVTVMVCEMGVRALGLPGGTPMRSDVKVRAGGVVTFLNEAPKSGAMLFV